MDSSPSGDRAPPEHRTPGFAIVPAEVLELGNGHAIAVYAAIAKHADPVGVAWPSVRRLSEITSWSRPTIHRAIGVLIAAGLLREESQFEAGMKRSNRYLLPLHNRKSPNGQMATTLPTMETSLPLDVKQVATGCKAGCHRSRTRELDSREQEREATAIAAPLAPAGHNHTTKASTIDPAFEPRPEDVKRIGEELRLSAPEIAFETRKFVDYYLANGKSMTDWSARWRTWMSRTRSYDGDSSRLTAVMATDREYEDIDDDWRPRGVRAPMARDDSSPLASLLAHKGTREEGANEQ